VLSWWKHVSIKVGAPLMFLAFSDVEAYLNSLINYESGTPMGGARDRPKLDPTYRALTRLQLPLSIPSTIHIAGTKGKGSVAAFLDGLLAPDHQVLSFTSPHLVSPKERVRLNGSAMDDDTWCRGFHEITEELRAEPPIRLSYFEMTFVFYMWLAHSLQTSIHVVEAGLGGKWDATNVLRDTLALLTLVDYDHVEILGHTLEEIAEDKAGIIKPRSKVVIGRQPGEARAVFRSAVKRNSAEAVFHGTDYGWNAREYGRFAYWDRDDVLDDLRLAVSGVHQRDNAVTAVRAARWIHSGISNSAVRQRLATCIIPGRQQFLPGIPDILADVAHNPVSFAALAETLRSEYSGRRLIAVVGMMKDKDAQESFRHLQGILTDVLVVRVKSPRTHDEHALAELLCGLGFRASTRASVDEAFAELHRSASHDLGLVTGSFYLVGDYFAWRQRAGIA
jgi:dihydrofolate synthase/folylpolyglutamate synthase